MAPNNNFQRNASLARLLPKYVHVRPPVEVFRAWKSDKERGRLRIARPRNRLWANVHAFCLRARSSPMRNRRVDVRPLQIHRYFQANAWPLGDGSRTVSFMLHPAWNFLEELITFRSQDLHYYVILCSISIRWTTVM